MVKKFKAIHNIDASDLVEKVNYNTKIDENEKKILHHIKYITTQEFNKLMAEKFAARSKHAKLTTKDDIADFVKNIDEKLVNINKKVTLNKKRHVDVKKN